MNRQCLPSDSPILLNPTAPVIARLFPDRSPDSPPILIVLDFDGTISPIVDIPSDARIQPDIRAALLRLGSLARLAILSGRSLADLKSRCAGIGDIELIGNHGIEEESQKPKDHRDLELSARIVAAWKQALSGGSSEAGKAQGTHEPLLPKDVLLENKTYSLTLHFRKGRQGKKLLEELRLAVGQLTPPPRLILGKQVWNLLPTRKLHKGTALLELRRKWNATHILFFGDDLTDEDAFRLPLPELTSILVAAAPPPYPTAAAFRVSDIESVAALLHRIADEIDPGASFRRPP